MKVLHYIAFTLLLVGGLNWGLVGIFELDLVAEIFGDMSGISKVVYALVGVSALWELGAHKGQCKWCKKSGKSGSDSEE